MDLELDPSTSAFGDCLRVVDAPDETTLDPDLPSFGWSGGLLLGGFALTISGLSGRIIVSFGKRRENLLPFSLRTDGELSGEGSSLVAPNGYCLAVKDNRVRDAYPRSRGVVDLKTGRILDFYYHVLFRNSAIELLLDVNPKLIPPPLYFPGIPHSGHVIAWISRLERDALEMSLAAGLFLPIGDEHDGIPVRLPPSENSPGQDEPFLARNSSLHPFVVWRARERRRSDEPRKSSGPAHASSSPLRAFENTVLEMQVLPRGSQFGDDFRLNAPGLGGFARGRSPLFGGLSLQLGKACGSKLPFVLQLRSPAPAFERKQAPFLQVLPPGTKPGLSGLSGSLNFPDAVYDQRELALLSDPYKLTTGFIDLTTGETGIFVFRGFFCLNLLRALMLVEPRTPSDSFAFICTGKLTLAPQLHLELAGRSHIPYPAGYRFPLPDNTTTVVASESFPSPFLRLEAVEKKGVATPESFAVSAGSFERGTADAHNVTYDSSTQTLLVGVETRTFSFEVSGASSQRVRDRTITTLVADRSRGIRSTQSLIAVIDSGEGSCELHLVSSDERLDCWRQRSNVTWGSGEPSRPGNLSSSRTRPTAYR